MLMLLSFGRSVRVRMSWQIRVMWLALAIESSARVGPGLISTVSNTPETLLTGLWEILFVQAPRFLGLWELSQSQLQEKWPVIHKAEEKPQKNKVGSVKWPTDDISYRDMLHWMLGLQITPLLQRSDDSTVDFPNVKEESIDVFD